MKKLIYTISLLCSINSNIQAIEIESWQFTKLESNSASTIRLPINNDEMKYGLLNYINVGYTNGDHKILTMGSTTVRIADTGEEFYNLILRDGIPSDDSFVGSARYIYPVGYRAYPYVDTISCDDPSGICRGKLTHVIPNTIVAIKNIWFIRENRDANIKAFWFMPIKTNGEEVEVGMMDNSPGDDRYHVKIEYASISINALKGGAWGWYPSQYCGQRIRSITGEAVVSGFKFQFPSGDRHLLKWEMGFPTADTVVMNVPDNSGMRSTDRCYMRYIVFKD